MSNFRFISCDWGTSNFRIRMVQVPEFKILAEVKNNRGVAQFDPQNPESFESHLLEALKQLDQQLEIPISNETLMISGMASASIGWKELPYASLPVPVGSSGLLCETMQELNYNNLPLIPNLISGLKSDEDVMRGEEVELMGLLSRPEIKQHLNKCRVILPGTHSKHIDVKDGIITDFNTHMTGELFDLMSKQSVLKHSLNSDRSFSESAFLEGVQVIEQKGFSQSLFKVRSLSLLKDASSNWCYSFLSGLCIGHECLSLKSIEYPIVCSASKSISKAYESAARQLKLEQFISLPSERHDLLAAEGQVLFIRNEV